MTDPPNPSERLDTITHEAQASIHELEQRIAALVDDVTFVLEGLAERRAEVQREREELDILYSLEEGHDHLTQAPGTSALRDSEDQLTNEVLKAETLERTLKDFGSVLSVASRQLSTGRELPDIDSTAQLAIQLAEIRAREDERRRFARDIHDGPAQAFANAIIGLEFIDRGLRSNGEDQNESAIAEIERVKNTMREGLTEIRRFIFDNRPTMLQDRGLFATVQHYVEQYQSIFPMLVSVSIEDDLPRLSPDQELTAFRVIQESIQNASKHARASRVDVRIWRDDAALHISIRDDGRGFTPDRVRTHAMGGNGLKSMEERVELIGASLIISSEPGEGTEILMTIEGSSLPPR